MLRLISIWVENNISSIMIASSTCAITLAYLTLTILKDLLIAIEINYSIKLIKSTGQLQYPNPEVHIEA